MRKSQFIAHTFIDVYGEYRRGHFYKKASPYVSLKASQKLTPALAGTALGRTKAARYAKYAEYETDGPVTVESNENEKATN